MEQKKKKKKSRKDGDISITDGPLSPFAGVSTRDSNVNNLNLLMSGAGVGGVSTATGLNGKPLAVSMSSRMMLDRMEIGEDDFDIDLDEAESGKLIGFTCVVVFLAAVDFGMVVPSLYPLIDHLGGSLSYAGVTFALSAGAQTVAAVLAGQFAAVRTIKPVLFVALACLVAGNVLYLIPASNNALVLLVLGRTLCGVGGGVVGGAYPHLIRHGAREKRYVRASLVSFIDTFPRLFSPLLGLLATKCSALTFATVTTLNMPAFFMVLLHASVLLVLALMPLLRWRPDWGVLDLFERSVVDESVDERSDLASLDSSGQRRRRLRAGVPTLDSAEALRARTERPQLSGPLFYMFFSATFAFWSLWASFLPVAFNYETNPADEQVPDWTAFSSYSVVYVTAAVYLVTFPGLKLLGVDSRSTKCVLLAYLAMVLGSLCWTNYENDRQRMVSDWQLYSGAVCLAMGFAAITIGLPGMYAHYVLADKGLLAHHLRTLSWFFSLSTSGRMIGPLWGILANHIDSTNLISQAGSILLISGVFMGFLCLTDNAHWFVDHLLAT